MTTYDVGCLTCCRAASSTLSIQDAEDKLTEHFCPVECSSIVFTVEGVVSPMWAREHSA